MMLIFLGLVILYFIIKAISNNQRDKKVLSENPIEYKFNIILEILNDVAFSGIGSITKNSWSNISLGEIGANQLIQLSYANEMLTVKWFYKYYQKEVIFEKKLQNANNLSVFEQQRFAEKLIVDMTDVINRHQIKVLEPISNHSFNIINNIHDVRNSNTTEETTEKPKSQKVIKEPVKKLNTLFVGKIKRHYSDYVINVLAGKAPNKLTIPIEKAIKIGFTQNRTYLINCTEIDSVDGERQFVFDATKELTDEEVSQFNSSDIKNKIEIVDV